MAGPPAARERRPRPPAPAGPRAANARIEQLRGELIPDGIHVATTRDYGLTASDKERLNTIATRLKQEAPSARLSVSGHTDSVGSDSYNQALSERRASSVAVYLISQGLEAGKVTSQGRGESEPLTDNESEEGRARNRRVELHLN